MFVPEKGRWFLQIEEFAESAETLQLDNRVVYTQRRVL